MKIVNRHTHTHTHTERKDENIIPPWHTSYAGGIKMKIANLQSAMIQIRQLIMSCLILVYTVCPLVFEFSK